MSNPVGSHQNLHLLDRGVLDHGLCVLPLHRRHHRRHLGHQEAVVVVAREWIHEDRQIHDQVLQKVVVYLE